MNIHRITAKLICIILLLGFIQPPIHSYAVNEKVTILGEIVNIREGPALSYPIMKKAIKGESYTLLKEDGEWYEVEISPNKKGWVANWLVQKEAPQKETSTSTNATTGTITGDSVRVRTGAGTSYDVIGSLNINTTVEIISEDSNWYEVKTKLGVGWVSKDFIKATAATAPTPNETNEGKTGYITATTLNIRSEPSLQSAVIGKLRKGDTIKIVSEQPEWVEVVFSGKKAWISSEYVNIDTTSPAPDKSAEKEDKDSLSGIIGTVTATTLNVRESSSLDSKIIGNVSKGQVFKLIEEENNWVKIEFKKNTYGWVAQWYLEKSMPKDDTSPIGTVKNSYVSIIYAGTNIRTGPSLNAKVIKIANTGETYPIKSIQQDWYEIELANGETGFVAGWIVSASGSVPQPDKTGTESGLKNKKIMIDPGHGGRDNGATGLSGTIEKRLTLKTGLLLYNKLNALGANVMLTRNNDQYVALSSRVSLANYHRVDAFVSVHYDSIANKTVTGMTTYYYNSKQKELATAVHESMNSYTKLKNRGVRVGDYHILRENTQPAVLLEIGYLSNPTEELLLNTNSFQEQVTNGIVHGLSAYFQNK